MSPRRHGFSAIELLVAMLLISLVLAISVPAWQNLRRRTSLRAAAATLECELRELRARAVSRGRNVGWSTRHGDDGRWYVTPIVDGDDDGLRADDLERGIDVPDGAERELLPPDLACFVGFPQGGIPDPSDPSHRLGPDDAPFRFGLSRFVSFSPLGASTSGSIFLSEPSGAALCLRLHGGVGRVHVLAWDPAERRWSDGP